MTSVARVAALAAATAVFVGAGAAWAAGLTVTSKSLGGVIETVPVFFPDSLATANAAATAGRPEANDTLTITFNQLVKVSSICTGAAQANATLPGVTFTITNGTAGANDVLTVTAGPAACPTPKVGSFDLGSPSFVTANTAYSSSTIALTLGASTTTGVLTLGTPATTATTVPGSVVARYTPDPAIQDTSNRFIGTNVAASASVKQF
jgi:hypothetical protein